MDNGTNILIYNDVNSASERSEILLDSSLMRDTPFSAVSIMGNTNGERILTLCEVFIYGKTYFSSCKCIICRENNQYRENQISNTVWFYVRLKIFMIDDIFFGFV